MCLSTAYYHKKDDNMIAAQYVDKIEIDGTNITLIDVMGMRIELTGRISYVDLTGGTVIIEKED